MLVLSRRESQRIRLGKSIVVTVVRVSGDKVRLGIEAPRDVLVLREELEPHEPGPHEPGPHEPGPHEPGPPELAAGERAAVASAT
ncbi:MAG: carbon storage regulator [Planctomycetes bacterium]|nr:carbon storage regulator [Planctomycetota bacterium]